VQDHYGVLGVAPDAEQVVIEAAYKALLKRYHPDVAEGDPRTAERRSRAINEAYRILRSTELRAQYDRERVSGRGFGSGGETPTPKPSAAARSAPQSTRKGNLVSNFYLALSAAVVAGAALSLSSLSQAPQGPLSNPEPAENLAEASPPNGPGTRAQPVEPVDETPRPADVRDAEAVLPRAGALAQPSFDCRKAVGPTLELVCSDPELAAADRRLAAAYRRLLLNADMPEAARAEQREWLAARDAAPVEVDVLLELYNQRLARIEEDTPPALF
jgi:uncharacterized protein YecT (DUF1311 family)